MELGVGALASPGEVFPRSEACAFSIRCGERLFSVDGPVVMGILNVTSDSFYSGCRSVTRRQIERRVQEIVREGGDMVDIGACSTRPGSTPVTERAERERLLRAVSVVRHVAPELPISIDTYRSGVADALLREFEGLIINDIAAGELDGEMFDVVASHGAPYILTHIQGTPTDMQRDPHYEDVVGEVLDFFVLRVARLRAMGVIDIILDPGFGFGKSVDHNYMLLRNMQSFRGLGLPILAGVSRKSMITKPLGIEPKDALYGTQVIDTLALAHGADILRVHDVRPAVEAVKLFSLYRRQPLW